MRTNRSEKAFTLVELLVVVAIISVLAALLMPALRSARDSALAISCMSRMKQIYSADTMYQGDYNGVMGLSLPDPGVYTFNQSDRWPVLLTEYLLERSPDWYYSGGNRYVANTSLRYEIVTCPVSDLGSSSIYLPDYGYNNRWHDPANKKPLNGGPANWARLTDIPSKYFGAFPILADVAGVSILDIRYVPHYLDYTDTTVGGRRLRHAERSNALFPDGHLRALNFLDSGYDGGRIPASQMSWVENYDP